MSLENPWGQVPEPEAEPEPELDDACRYLDELCERIKPLLADHPPEMQGAVLAQLLATFLVGHPPDVRAEIFKLHIDSVIDLMKPIEMLMFGREGHPDGRERDQCP